MNSTTDNSRVVYSPTNYTAPTTSCVREGSILVTYNFRGVTVSQVEGLVRKAAELHCAAKLRKISGTSKWYKATAADTQLWEIIDKERKYSFQVAQFVPGASVVVLTPVQAIDQALDGGMNAEELHALVTARAEALRKAAEPAAGSLDAELNELAEAEAEAAG